MSDGMDISVEEQFRRDIEADRLAAEAREADGAVAEADDEPHVEAEPAPEPAKPAPVIEYQPTPPTMTVRLSEPFTVDGVLVEAIELRAPSLIDVRRVIDGDDTLMDMYATMSGLPVEALDRLKFPDGDRVLGAANLLSPEMQMRS